MSVIDDVCRHDAPMTPLRLVDAEFAHASGVFQPGSGELLARAALRHHDDQRHVALRHYAVLKGLNHYAARKGLKAPLCVSGGSGVLGVCTPCGLFE